MKENNDMPEDNLSGVENSIDSFDANNNVNTDNSIKNDFDEEQDLTKCPQSVIDYLNKKKLTLVTFNTERERCSTFFEKGKSKSFNQINPVQEIKAALLKKGEGHKKDFSFKFSEPDNFYFFITKENNPNYLKPVLTAASKRKRRRRPSGDSEESEESKSTNKTDGTSSSSSSSSKNENNYINLNIDYNKYLIKAVLAKKKNSGNLEIFHTELLNREVCQVSHTTKDSISYYRATKDIKSDEEKNNFEGFELLMPEKYFILEVEVKKPAGETTLKEDGITTVLYLLTAKKSQIIDLFVMVKYSLYFIRETLCNYIGKYIRDMIYDFSHLPSECFEDFLSHIGSMKEGQDDVKLDFPLKNEIKVFEKLSQSNQINHIFRNLTNIYRDNSRDKVPFHKFILLVEKYKLYFAEKEYRIKNKYLKEENIKEYKEYQFLKSCSNYGQKEFEISKDSKLDLNKVITHFFALLEKFLKENWPKEKQNKQTLRNFFIQNLCKYLLQYASFKGFINIDIVINEDNVFDIQCCQNKNCNASCNSCMYCCAVNSLKFINRLFKFNEGFFHEHINIMDYSYNFNEKNVIHTFLTINDSSKKNRLRIFDIPFMQKWCYQIAGLILTLYRDSFGFLRNYNIENINIPIDFNPNFVKLFGQIHDDIIKDLFKYYNLVIPDFYKLTEKMSVSPLNKYNCLDNLCQNFAITSLQYLMRNNIIFFLPYNVVYHLDESKMFRKPSLNSIYEPWLVLMDQRILEYMKQKENKEQYLEKNGHNIEYYFKEMKHINNKRVHYVIFTSNKKNAYNDNFINTSNNIIQEDEDIINSSNEKLSLKNIYTKKITNSAYEASSEYSFYYFFNLYYNFIYSTMKEMKNNIVDYFLIKKVLDKATLSKNDLNKTIILENKDNTEDKNKEVKKGKKDLIKENLNRMKKLTRLTRHMNYIFYDYVTETAANIIMKSESKIKEKIEKSENYYMKIGHYIVNFRAFGYKDKWINSFETFKNGDLYKKLEDDSYYLGGKDNNNLINTS